MSPRIAFGRVRALAKGSGVIGNCHASWPHAPPLHAQALTIHHGRKTLHFGNENQFTSFRRANRFMARG